MIHGTRRSTLIPALIVLAAAGPALAQSSLPPDLSGRVPPSVASLRIELPDGKTTAATGFLTLKDGVLAVAWHKVADARRVVARFSNGEEYECSGVIDKDAKRNVALIRIKLFGRPVLNMSAAEPPAGSPVTVAAVKDGAFGLIQASVTGSEVLDGVKFGRLAGDFPDGNNGSPVLDPSGAVIGLVVYRAIEGGSIPVFLPAAYILGLDASLPTQPWGTSEGAAASPAGQPATSLAEVDARIGQALLAISDDGACLAWAFELTRGFGFRNGVPEVVYRVQQGLDAAMTALNEARTDDELRRRIGRGVLQAMANQKAASEGFIRAVVIGQQANTWGAQSQDAQKRANSLLQAVAEQIAGLRPDLKALEQGSPKFREFLPVEQRYLLGLAERPSGFRLGVTTYPRNPFYLLIVAVDSLANKIGLKPGDIIVSAAGKTYTGEDDFEDFKLLIKANLGKTLPVVVKRGGKDQTVNLKIPKEIPPDAFYVN
jgi:S1-C subfamily serine protease